jgi:hypothetical protein
MSEWKEGDPNAWRGEEESIEEKAANALAELKEFMDAETIAIEQGLGMIPLIEDWRRRFSIIVAEPLRHELDEALNKSEIRVAIHYLEFFNEIKERELTEEECIVMAHLLEVLEHHFASFDKSEERLRTGLKNEMYEAMQRITSSHPDALLGE